MRPRSSRSCNQFSPTHLIAASPLGGTLLNKCAVPPKATGAYYRRARVESNCPPRTTARVMLAASVSRTYLRHLDQRNLG
jgi:hypothetical protein